MVHASKKDWWLVLILVGLGIFLAGMAIHHILVRGNHPATWTMGGLTASYVGIFVLFGYPLTYEIQPEDIVVRGGLLMRYHIPIAGIQEVIPTRSPISSPALSLDRLRITYRKKGKGRVILISPEDKQAFLQDMARADKALELQGDRLARRA